MVSKEASSDLPELSNTLAEIISSADSSQSGYMKPERTLEQLENDAYRNQILDALMNQSQLNNPGSTWSCVSNRKDLGKNRYTNQC